MLEWAVQNDIGPTAIRFPKAKATEFSHTYEFKEKSQVVRYGEHTLIISCGNLLQPIMEAVNISGTNPTVIDARFIMPFDFETFYKYANSHKKIIIAEEGVFGGLSNVILAKLSSKSEIISKILFVNASKFPTTHTSRTVQLHENGLSPKAFAELLSQK
jgi:1-deoxy-D-xylulose-5-phosphate synthase